MTTLLELAAVSMMFTLVFGSTAGWASFALGLILGGLNFLFGFVAWSKRLLFLFAIVFAVGASCESLFSYLWGWK